MRSFIASTFFSTDSRSFFSRIFASYFSISRFSDLFGTRSGRLLLNIFDKYALEFRIIIEIWVFVRSALAYSLCLIIVEDSRNERRGSGIIYTSL
jgi:hypothetical protein